MKGDETVGIGPEGGPSVRRSAEDRRLSGRTYSHSKELLVARAEGLE